MHPVLLLATSLKCNLSKFQLHPTIIGVSPPIQISSHKNLVFHSLIAGLPLQKHFSAIL